MAHMTVAAEASTSLRDRVAAEVRALRGRHSVSQAQLGELLGLSQPQISARLRGRVEFSLSEIERLAEIFGVEPASILGFAPANAGGPPPGIPRPTGVNHLLHAVLTALTCGAWGVVWLALAVLSTRPERQGPMSRWATVALACVVLALAAASAWSSAHDVITRGY